ncbi:MAG: hypothetical protein JO148_04565, partial [Acidimicrobiia bacterium]|nr:hypothetical protein [Acidimicrobiia bacterium]
GDRDDFCSVADGLCAYRALAEAEPAVVPNAGHLITPAVVAVMIDFLERWS